MSACFFILYRSVHHTDLHSFPTRRSSDLWFQSPAFLRLVHDTLGSRSFRESPYWTSGWWQKALERVEQGQLRLGWTIDRKSTRLNSSHITISYAVFCLKKKKMLQRPGLEA